MKQGLSRAVFAMIVVVALTVPCFSSPVVTDDSMLASPSEVFVLDQRALRRLSSKALDGNVDAAEIVVRHYDAVGSMQEIEYWTQIAAENGSALMMREYSISLIDGTKSGDWRRCRRALFWHERARNTGSCAICLRGKLISECYVGCRYRSRRH
jgi:hypothetical protein